MNRIGESIATWRRIIIGIHRLFEFIIVEVIVTQQIDQMNFLSYSNEALTILFGIYPDDPTGRADAVKFCRLHNIQLDRFHV